MTTVFFDQPCSRFRLYVTTLQSWKMMLRDEAWWAQGHTVCVSEEFFRLSPLPFYIKAVF